MNEQIFYKYKNINNYTYDLLLNNEFYYSFPHEMNDPFDCYVYSESRGEKDDYINFLNRVSGSIEKKNNVYRLLESCNYNTDEINKQIKIPVRNNRNEDALINCFSTVNDSIIMWSHYANFHKGICLGFKAIGMGDSICFEVDDIVTDLGPESNKYAPLFEVNTLNHYLKPLMD